MGVHHYVLPDCPECGRELQRIIAYEPGTQTEENPLGAKVFWYSCPCGWESVQVNEKEFEELTYRLILEV